MKYNFLSFSLIFSIWLAGENTSASANFYDPVLLSTINNVETEKATVASPSNIAKENRIIKGFEIKGNTVISTDELEELLQEFLEKQIPFGQIGKNIRTVITEYYLKKGYIASFATVSQGEKPGFIRINIVEGRIDRVNILEVKGYLRKNRVKSLVERKILGDVYNVELTAKKLSDLIIVDRDIKTMELGVDADLSRPGKVVLNVTVEAIPAFTLSTTTANTGSPAFGEITNTILLDTRAIGNGDRLNVIGIVSEGNSGVILGYSLPISPSNIKIFANYSSDGGEVGENPFNFASINLRSRSYRLGVEFPLIEDPFERLKIGFSLGVERSLGLLEDVGAPIVRGADDSGNLRVTTLRFPISYLRRNEGDTFDWEFALNSELVVGIEFLDATISDRGLPDGTFALINNEIGYLKVLDTDTETFLQVKGLFQIAGDSLPAFEARSLGGFGTVRGYRQAILFNDNIIFLSGQLSTSILKNENISLASVFFVDFGKGWDTNSFVSNSNSLFSIGAGLRFSFRDRIFILVDYAIPLTSPPTEFVQKSLQDRGLSVGVSFKLLEF